MYFEICVVYSPQLFNEWAVMLKKSEREGIIYGVVATFLWSFFPVLLNKGAQTLPPLAFVAVVTLFGVLPPLVFSVFTGHLRELKKKEAYGNLLMVSLFIVVIPWSLISVGSQYTSGANTSILLLTEIIYTVLFTHFIGERMSLQKILSALGVFLGAILIIYSGSFEVNVGDIIIALAPMSYPIGNFYNKKSLNYVSPATITWVRFFCGGVFLMGLSFFFEPGVDVIAMVQNNWMLVLVVGFLVLGIRTVLAYESLKRLDISKFIFIVMIFPVFSLFTLVVFFGETLSVYQIAGAALMLTSVYFAAKKPSTDPKLTKYAA